MAQLITNTSHSISYTPKTGFKVVMAPGLTTCGPRNPCHTCPVFGRDMDGCSTKCKYAAARSSYLDHIGGPGMVAAVDPADGNYGFGC